MAERRPDRMRGSGHDQFWDWCNREELRLQQCANCGRISWPAVTACAHCGKPDLTWQRMSGAGRIVSWCTFERDYYNGALPLPWETILVELTEGPLFISNPLKFGWRDITANMPVRVAFIDAEDSTGAFKLPVFERA
jgi:uncharacterized OB-fold protein